MYFSLVNIFPCNQWLTPKNLLSTPDQKPSRLSKDKGAECLFSTTVAICSKPRYRFSVIVLYSFDAQVTLSYTSRVWKNSCYLRGHLSISPRASSIYHFSLLAVYIGHRLILLSRCILEGEKVRREGCHFLGYLSAGHGVDLAFYFWLPSLPPSPVTSVCELSPALFTWTCWTVTTCCPPLRNFCMVVMVRWNVSARVLSSTSNGISIKIQF